MDSELDKKTIERAQALAHLFLEDELLAGIAVEQAIQFLPIWLRKQKKRSYHRAASGLRKARFSELQMLQWQILERTTPIERRQEASETFELCPRTFVKRYVKFLVTQSWPTTLFHVNVAISRFLFDYGNAGSMAIYESVFQDSFLDDSIYRRSRLRLLDALRTRFPRVIQTERHGKQGLIIRHDDNSQIWWPLVDTLLERLTPWNSQCVTDPLPEEAHATAHEWFHPHCFARWADALDLPTPQEVLMIPHGTDGPDDAAPIQSNEDKVSTPLNISDQKPRQTIRMARHFEVRADDLLIAHWSPRQQGPLRLDLPDHARLVDVWAVHADQRSPIASFFVGNPNGEQSLLRDHCQNAAFSIDMELNFKGETAKLLLQQRMTLVGWLMALWQSVRASLFRPGGWFVVVAAAAFALGFFLAEGVDNVPKTTPVVTRSGDDEPLERQPYTEAIAHAYFERGLYHFERKTDDDYARALDDFLDAHALLPRDKRIVEYLIFTYEVLGDQAQAQAYNEYLESLE